MKDVLVLVLDLYERCMGAAICEDIPFCSAHVVANIYEIQNS